MCLPVRDVFGSFGFFGWGGGQSSHAPSEVMVGFWARVSASLSGVRLWYFMRGVLGVIALESFYRTRGSARIIRVMLIN